MATDDTSEYLDNTDEQVEMLLVTNFDELESGLSKILDESGPILKRNLAQVTQAVAIDNLADIVSGLGNVKRHLRDIVDQTIFVQDKVSQLKLGLSESKNRLIGSFCLIPPLRRNVVWIFTHRVAEPRVTNREIYHATFLLSGGVP